MPALSSQRNRPPPQERMGRMGRLPGENGGQPCQHCHQRGMGDPQGRMEGMGDPKRRMGGVGRETPRMGTVMPALGNGRNPREEWGNKETPDGKMGDSPGRLGNEGTPKGEWGRRGTPPPGEYGGSHASTVTGGTGRQRGISIAPQASTAGVLGADSWTPTSRAVIRRHTPGVAKPALPSPSVLDPLT